MSAAPRQLTAFLHSHRVRESDWNVVGMGGRWIGKFKVEDQEYLHFLRLVHNAVNIEGQETITLSERHPSDKSFGPILIDLEFRFNDDGARPVQRCVTSRHIKAFIAEYIAAMNYFLDMSGVQNPRFFVQMKSLPEIHRDGIKDGVHIICPDIVLDYSILYALRGYMINKMYPIFGSMNNKADFYEVFDPHVIKRNNWFIYGCGKHEKSPYKVTHVYKHTSEGLIQEAPVFYNTCALTQLLSLCIGKSQQSNISIKPHRQDYWDKLLTLWSGGKVYVERNALHNCRIIWRRGSSESNQKKIISVSDLLNMLEDHANTDEHFIYKFMRGFNSVSTVINPEIPFTTTSNDIIWSLLGSEIEYYAPFIQAIKAGSGIECAHIEDLILCMMDASFELDEVEQTRQLPRERSDSDIMRDMGDSIVLNEEANRWEEEWQNHYDQNNDLGFLNGLLCAYFCNFFIITDNMKNIGAIIVYTSDPQEYWLEIMQTSLRNCVEILDEWAGAHNLNILDRKHNLERYLLHYSNEHIRDNNIHHMNTNIEDIIIKISRIFIEQYDGVVMASTTDLAKELLGKAYQAEEIDHARRQLESAGLLDDEEDVSGAVLVAAMPPLDYDEEEDEEIVEPPPIQPLRKKVAAPTIPRRIAYTLIQEQVNNAAECPIRMELLTHENAAITGCYHFFEKDAIASWFVENNTCPQCREHTCVLTVGP